MQQQNFENQWWENQNQVSESWRHHESQIHTIPGHAVQFQSNNNCEVCCNIYQNENIGEVYKHSSPFMNDFTYVQPLSPPYRDYQSPPAFDPLTNHISMAPIPNHHDQPHQIPSINALPSYSAYPYVPCFGQFPSSQPPENMPSHQMQTQHVSHSYPQLFSPCNSHMHPPSQTFQNLQMYKPTFSPNYAQYLHHLPVTEEQQIDFLSSHTTHYPSPTYIPSPEGPPGEDRQYAYQPLPCIEHQNMEQTNWDEIFKEQTKLKEIFEGQRKDLDAICKDHGEKLEAMVRRICENFKENENDVCEEEKSVTTHLSDSPDDVSNIPNQPLTRIFSALKEVEEVPQKEPLVGETPEQIPQDKIQNDEIHKQEEVRNIMYNQKRKMTSESILISGASSLQNELGAVARRMNVAMDTKYTRKHLLHESKFSRKVTVITLVPSWLQNVGYNADATPDMLGYNDDKMNNVAEYVPDTTIVRPTKSTKRVVSLKREVGTNSFIFKGEKIQRQRIFAGGSPDEGNYLTRQFCLLAMNKTELFVQRNRISETEVDMLKV